MNATLCIYLYENLPNYGVNEEMALRYSEKYKVGKRIEKKYEVALRYLENKKNKRNPDSQRETNFVPYSQEETLTESAMNIQFYKTRPIQR